MVCTCLFFTTFHAQWQVCTKLIRFLCSNAKEANLRKNNLMFQLSAQGAGVAGAGAGSAAGAGEGTSTRGWGAEVKHTTPSRLVW